MNMTLKTRQAGGVTIVDISGRIVLGGESAAVRDTICELLDEGRKQLLLNLAEVDSIDSVGLGSLVGAVTSVRRQGGDVKLFNLTNKVTDIMQMTKLYTVFEVVKDEAAGVKSFDQTTAAARA
ncbi:MAG TPA: STAS domain-containing protein [Candidatus Limnocylindrales bacterium]|nr:STAS domain-containing protein [Candidatus Limnocylindrales bacterium]